MGLAKSRDFTAWTSAAPWPCRHPREGPGARGDPRISGTRTSSPRQPNSRMRGNADGLRLHRLEPMREAARHGERLGTRLEMDDRLVAPVTLDARDRAEIDDRAAMHLPEGLGIELLVELLDRLANEAVAIAGDDLRVLVLGLEVQDIVDGDHRQRVAERRAHPAQRRRRIARGKAREHRIEVERRALQARLEPRDDLGDAIGCDRLQQVVDRTFLERRDRVFVVRGDEHDVQAAAERARDVEAVAPGHADVKECDVGLVRACEQQRLVTVRRRADDAELGPRLAEPRLQLRGQHRLVFGDEGSGHQSCASGIDSVASVPPPGAAAIVSFARSPYKAASRSRMLLRPTPMPGDGVSMAPTPVPVSRTRTTSRSPSVVAVTSTRPPWTVGSRPCLTAFSTSEMTRLGGNAAPRSASGTSTANARRSPIRILRMLRYASMSRASWPSVDDAARSCGSDARR